MNMEEYKTNALSNKLISMNNLGTSASKDIQYLIEIKLSEIELHKYKYKWYMLLIWYFFCKF